jgi:hypothetical protein
LVINSYLWQPRNRKKNQKEIRKLKDRLHLGALMPVAEFGQAICRYIIGEALAIPFRRVTRFF